MAYARNWRRDRCPSHKTAIVCSFVFIVIILVVAVPVSLCTSRCDCPSPAPIGPACPTKWIGYLGTCYYLSREERNWTSSQNFCISQNASLATIETEAKDFVNLFKLKYTYWIGLKRGPGQPWKWPNGEKTTLEVLGDGGDCAFFNDEAKASSSRCSTEHHWMCSKADALQNPK